MKNPTWRVIHIGYLNRNIYWGEDQVYRGQVCTTTLIETDNRRILVDPGLTSHEEFRTILFQRSGLRPEDIDTIFFTHFHLHHWQSHLLFPKSVWLMSRAEIRFRLNNKQTPEEERDLLARIIPIEDHHLPGVEFVSTPGHTRGSASLMFETREGMVLVAGDAVLTFDHFDNREPSEKADNPREARRSIDKIAKIADIVVPGHDNFFVV